MPVDLSIENVPNEVVRRLRRRADRNYRSLQDELLAIVEDAVQPDPQPAPRPVELLAEIRRLGLGTSAEAAAIVRADRDRH